MLVDGADQLLNIDWLGKKWMPVDVYASLDFGRRNQRRKENDRCVLQFGVRPNLCCDFASVPDRHDYIQQDQVRPKNPGARVSPGRVVLFKHEILTCFFEKDSNQVSGVRVVINDQDPPLFVDSGGWS